jgi:hypothetical protein
MDMAGREIVFRDLRQQHCAESGARTRWFLAIAAGAPVAGTGKQCQ